MTNTMTIRELQPTYFYMSVDFDDVDATAEVIRASYRGVQLRVEYDSEKQDIEFMTGDFADDYNAAIAYAITITSNHYVPIIGSSSVDTFMYLGKYK